jgi:transposase
MDPLSSAGFSAEDSSRLVKLKPVDRSQMRMLTVEVDKLVEPDDPVRAIWEFVGRMDLSLFYEAIRSREGQGGCSAYDPRVVISLWLWSYSEGIGSARELSRLCESHPACRWLTGCEVINYHTLSDFRVSHQEALDQLFVRSLGVLSSEGLLILKRVDHDGTKVRADAKLESFRSRTTLEKHLEEARQQVRRLADPEGPETTDRRRKANERSTRERQERLEQAISTLNTLERKPPQSSDRKIRVSESDPDCRIMKHRGGGLLPSYNVQITTDGQAGIIVSTEVSQSGSDAGGLEPAVERVQSTLGHVPKQAVTDGGYVSRETILAMHEKHIELIAPVPDHQPTGQAQLVRRGISPEFFPEKFSYEATKNACVCPAGKVLPFERTETKTGITHHYYRASYEVCRGCPLKPQCCPENQKKGRSVVRSEEHPEVLSFKKRMETPAAKEDYKKRGRLIEFVHAWIKEKMRFRRFHVRGRVKAGMEMTWVALAYNLRQWTRLSWTPELN